MKHATISSRKGRTAVSASGRRKIERYEREWSQLGHKLWNRRDER